VQTIDEAMTLAQMTIALMALMTIPRTTFALMTLAKMPVLE
jgi:hypothetical protein